MASIYLTTPMYIFFSEPRQSSDEIVQFPDTLIRHSPYNLKTIVKQSLDVWLHTNAGQNKDCVNRKGMHTVLKLSEMLIQKVKMAMVNACAVCFKIVPWLLTIS